MEKVKIHPALKLSPYEINQLTLKDIEKIESQVPNFRKILMHHKDQQKIIDKIIQKQSELELHQMFVEQYVEDWEYSQIVHQSKELMEHIAIWHCEGIDDTEKYEDALKLSMEIEEHLFPMLKDYNQSFDTQFPAKTLPKLWKDPQIDTFYYLLHVYIIFKWNSDSKFTKWQNIEHFKLWYNKFQPKIRFGKKDANFNDIKKLIKDHQFKVDVTGITKNIEQLIFPKTAGKYKKLLVEDYIKLARDKKIPIKEEKIYGMSSKTLGFPDLWHFYGTLALDYEIDETDPEKLIFKSALKRFRESVTNDENILIPMLIVLFNDYANDKEWFSRWVGDGEHDFWWKYGDDRAGMFSYEDIGALKNGKGHLAFAERLIREYSIIDNQNMMYLRGDDDSSSEGDSSLSKLEKYYLCYDWIRGDWYDFRQTYFNQELSFGTYIKNKYFKNKF